MQSEIPYDVVEAARVLNMKLHSATELGQRTQWIAEALLAERKAALSAADPSVSVEALRWKGPDSSGEYHSLDGLWGYIIRSGNGNGFWLTEIGDYFPSPEAAQAAAQRHYNARILSTLTAQVQDVAGWRDISTAPKDGTMIIAYGLGVISLSRWVENFAPVYHWDGGPAFYSYVLDRPHSPTHWMHLPSPPTSQEG